MWCDQGFLPFISTPAQCGAYAMAVWMAKSGGKDDDDPCPDIQKKISDTIKGVGMPGNKSLLTRVVEQYVGEVKFYAGS